MKMKRTTALFLALAMLLTLTTAAFAQGIIPAADKLSVKKGEQVKVTTTVEEAISGVCTAEFRVFYDDTLFDYEYEATKAQEKTSGITITKPDASKDPAHCVRYTYSTAEVDGASFTAGQKLATLVFTAKEDVTARKTAEFTSEVYTMSLVDGTHPVDKFTKKVISVTVTPVSAAYSVSAAAVNPSITVNEDAQVALKISNDVSETYNAYYLEVNYNSDLLAYKSISPADASVTDTNGTLKIAGYGSDKTCGTDNLVLTFTGKATGRANVIVQSAKVDALANAAEKDAPAAAIETATATIAVGSYQVTLPDDFTGAGTAAPGSDYTFTAKDPSLTYDFTGSTMGDKDVTVVKNPDGTYTVKNVTGPLVIKAAAMVSIEETGNGWSDVSRSGWTQSGDTVKAGTALNMTITPQDGRTYVVTVNGTALTAMVRPGMPQQIYTIPASMVTGGELTIDVSYTEEGAITIIKTGNALGDVSSSDCVGWDFETGEVTDTGTATVSIKPATGKTMDDYVVTINGEKQTLNSTGRGPRLRYVAAFVPAEVAVDGRITIDVSYKQSAPAYTVSVSEYVKLNNQSIFLVTASGDVADGKVLAYNGSQMYWSAKYNAYAWLVISTDSLDTVKTAAEAAVTAVDGTQVKIAYNGDVNLTGSVDINDAQLVWNMYNAKYSDFTAVNIRKFLEADMNGDKTLDTKDATAIVTDYILQ